MYKTSSGIIIPSKEQLEPLSLWGCDGEVYRYDDYAVKFLKPSFLGIDYNMSLEKLQKFIEILRHELLISPNEIVYDNCEKYVAYLMSYVRNKGIQSLSCAAFLKSIEELVGCFDFFTENGILVYDAHGKNIIVNEKIFLIDFDRFFIGEKTDDLAEYNYLQYEKMVWKIIVDALLLSYSNDFDYRHNYAQFLIKHLPILDVWSNTNAINNKVINFFTEDLKHYETMEEYLLERRESIIRKSL